MYLSSCIHGFHEYQAIWEPKHGEELDCSREIDNNDPYAVSIMKRKEVLGHIPHKISMHEDVCHFYEKWQKYIDYQAYYNRRPVILVTYPRGYT